MTSELRPPRPPRHKPFRVPGVVVPILCAGVGWLLGGWGAAVVAGILGVVVWRTR